MPNERNAREEFKQNFNMGVWLLEAHQRAITIPMRNNCGLQAIAWPCLWALCLMLLWGTFTRDRYMLWWILFWMLCQFARRIEAIKNKQRIPSLYPGWPRDAMMFCRSEKVAKLIVEPVMVGIFGLIVLAFYRHMGWNAVGLPSFLLAGCFSLPLVEGAYRAAWERKKQAMRDAQMEAEMLNEEFEREGR